MIFNVTNYVKEFDFIISPVNPSSKYKFTNFNVYGSYSTKTGDIINATITASISEINVWVHIFDIPKTDQLVVHMNYSGNTTTCDKYTKCKFIDGTWIFPKNENMKFSKYVRLPYGYESDSYSGGVQIFYNDKWEIWFDKPTYYYQTIPYKKTGYEIDLSYDLYLQGIFWGAIVGTIVGIIFNSILTSLKNHMKILKILREKKKNIRKKRIIMKNWLNLIKRSNKYKKIKKFSLTIDNILTKIESKAIDYGIVILLLYLWLSLVRFLLDNRHDFNINIQIVTIATTLGGLSFAGGSFQKKLMKKKYLDEIFRASVEFIISGFLILSSFFMSEYPPTANCHINFAQQIGCWILEAIFIVCIIFGPLFLSAGFARLVSTIKKYYFE